MKILLISANRERDPYPVFPIGLAFLASPLIRAGHNLAAIDLCLEQEPKAAVAAALTEHRPQAVLISLRNLDNVTWPASRSYLPDLADLVAICRPHSTVIVGGSGFSLMPQEVLEAAGADYGLVGEGEEALPLLLERLEQGRDPAGIPGLVLPRSGSFVPPRPVERIGTPLRTLFNVGHYHRIGGMANVQTKRGCPFSCTYCTYPLLEGHRVRLRPVGEIVAEIRALVDDCGVSYLYFVDDIFNYPPDFAAQLCRAMTAAHLPVNWSAFINPDFITPELLDHMLAAGCDAIEFGSDSGSPAMLRNLHKSFTADDLRRASQLCSERELDFAHYLLFGGPGETRETIMESFHLMDELEPTAVIAMTGIRIYPNTRLYETALAEGVVTPATDMLEPVFYIAPQVRGFFSELITTEAMQRRNWVVPGLEVNTSSAMLDAIRLFQVKGPLWKLIKKLGRSHHRPLNLPDGPADPSVP
ncbi:lipid biosynthesis B12-binding/radical SAM protein [Geobacter sp. SVR]|uniref:lipid biosynthesis B12-binding/radical SAM protein n=1 Tax=Geobacter sp. SVR TaxID=2495594 RepID=UPI00143F02E3|nr:lipid biosynthesis B12-binding/radical SAM protein [Geobacter sp. SVR]BCS54298.1 B12-binding domain-containing radical SAM protein [Geobacter sp. SVR]GCF85843.1 B12-binding domain-containing radical SAM protein [Geobacter sp. SVR]